MSGASLFEATVPRCPESKLELDLAFGRLTVELGAATAF
jgi:hypothetical protein